MSRRKRKVEWDGQEAYLSLAEELAPSGNPDFPSLTMDDFDPEFIEAAHAYAREHHYPWPPPPSNSGWMVTVIQL